jgi:uncharacterized protein DUF6891
MTTTSVLRAEDFDDLHDYIRVQVAAGYAPIDEIVADAVEAFGDVAADATALRAAAHVLADLALRSHLQEQALWPQTTDCDRLDEAFADLERSGIVARQHFSCCGTCGAQEIRDEMSQAEKAGLAPRGFTFFHIQDTEHAVAGDSLYLSYGSARQEDSASVAIGHEVMQTLARYGLSPKWNGKYAHRIALPLTWQRWRR